MKTLKMRIFASCLVPTLFSSLATWSLVLTRSEQVATAVQANTPHDNAVIEAAEYSHGFGRVQKDNDSDIGSHRKSKRALIKFQGMWDYPSYTDCLNAIQADQPPHNKAFFWSFIMYVEAETALRWARTKDLQDVSKACAGYRDVPGLFDGNLTLYLISF